MLDIRVGPNQIRAQDLSAFVEKYLLTPINSLIPKPTKLTYDHIDQRGAVKRRLLNKIFELGVVP